MFVFTVKSTWVTNVTCHSFSHWKNREPTNGAVLCGVMRIGLVAKGLLIKGDMDLELVLMCRDKPTQTLLDTVCQHLPTQIEVRDTDAHSRSCFSYTLANTHDATAKCNRRSCSCIVPSSPMSDIKAPILWCVGVERSVVSVGVTRQETAMPSSEKWRVVLVCMSQVWLMLLSLLQCHVSSLTSPGTEKQNTLILHFYSCISLVILNDLGIERFRLFS